MAWLNDQIHQGVPCWPLYVQLSEMISSDIAWEEMEVLIKTIRLLEDTMVDRNVNGIELEKKGEIGEAIALYEANISDRFDGSHPYNRLRIIYESLNDYANAIRVCESYINNGGHDEKLCKLFRLKIAKLKGEESGR